MCVFQKALEDLSSRMAGAEAIQSGWQNPTDAPEAAEMLEQLQKFGDRLGPIQRNIEEANDQASLFANSSVIVSHALLAKLEDLNTRYRKNSIDFTKWTFTQLAPSTLSLQICLRTCSKNTCTNIFV